MNDSSVISIPVARFGLWEKTKTKRNLIQFDLEVTARCNNNCRHCYINLRAGDLAAKASELSPDEIGAIADEAVSLGALWCLITGGEPLLREDFEDIYLCLKRKGLLVSVFTNAGLVTERHVDFFKKYPPRDLEISVYGATKETYEAVTGMPGSFDAFMRGIDLLHKGGIKTRFKAMALRSNFHELAEIARFSRKRAKDAFRFDPFLHLRFDGNPVRNKEILSERLTPEEIVGLERSDPERFESLQKKCDSLIVPEFSADKPSYLFTCGAGTGCCSISSEGIFRLCSSLWHPDCVCDLRKGTLTEAWRVLVPKVRAMHSGTEEFLTKCRSCPVINLCLWCPAHAHLETGKMDAWVEYFCQVAHERQKAFQTKVR